MTQNQNNNEIQIKPTLSARGTWAGRGDFQLYFRFPRRYRSDRGFDYDPSPTTGLVVGDTLQYVQPSGTITNLVVSVITNGTTISVTPNSTTITSAAAGDWIRLKALDVLSFTMLPPVLWSNARSSALVLLLPLPCPLHQLALIRVRWRELEFDFTDNKGEHRSGGQDPATLLRKPAKATLTIKKYWDSPADMQSYNNLVGERFTWFVTTRLIRLASDSLRSPHHLQPPCHQLTQRRSGKLAEINYSEIKYIAQQDSSDNQAFAVTVLSSNTSLT